MKDYAVTAAGNDKTAAGFLPENMRPGRVNDELREFQAAVAADLWRHNDAFRDLGPDFAATYASATEATIPGDATALYPANSRVRGDHTGGAVRYATVVSSTYNVATVTTRIALAIDDGLNLLSDLLALKPSRVPPTGKPIHREAITGLDVYALQTAVVAKTGGAFTGAVTGPSGDFTALSRGGSAVWDFGNLAFRVGVVSVAFDSAGNANVPFLDSDGAPWPFGANIAPDWGAADWAPPADGGSEMGSSHRILVHRLSAASLGITAFLQTSPFSRFANGGTFPIRYIAVRFST